MFSGISTVDVVIGVFVLLIVVRGARMGLLAGIFSLVGVIAGAAIGSRVAQHLLSDGQGAVFGAGITVVSILVFAVVGDMVARSVSGVLRSYVTGSTSRTLDTIGGAALGLALGLTIVWAVGIFALQTPSFLGISNRVEQSRIVDELDSRMPSELITSAVSNLDPLPQVRGPEPNLEQPTAEILRDPDVATASESTVRVTGIACGYGVEGSGWVAAPDLIVTNAHVVAGETTTSIQPGGFGRSYDADVVSFDSRNDIAILRVSGLGLTPLQTARPERGEDAAVIGFPENGPLDLRAARVGDTNRVLSSDAYNQGPVERMVTSFRVFVRPGNSGGPVVNADGHVVSTVFASRADSNDAGYGVPSHIVERRLQTAADNFSPVDTGPCAN